MAYDYGRKRIAKALGLSGVEAEHIAQKLRRQGVDEQAIDFEGAISDARDYGDRYGAVKKHIHDYYGVNMEGPGDVNMTQFQEQALNDLVSTKEGVKQALQQYYAKRGSQSNRDMIKDRLLTSEPAANVLMVALYDGADMPLAKRFLKEALGEPVPDLPPPEILEQIHPVIQEKIMRERAKRFQFIDRIMIRVQNFSPPEINLRFDKDKPGPMTRYMKDTGSKFKQSARMLVTDYKKHYNPSVIDLQKRNELFKQKMMPLALQVEYMTMIRKRDELARLSAMFPQAGPPTATSILQDMFFKDNPQREAARRMRGPLTREGYHVEQRVKLPTGYRWTKNKKGGK